MSPDPDVPGQEMSEQDVSCALILMNLSNRHIKKSVATVIGGDVENDDGPMKCDQKTKFSCPEGDKCNATSSTLSRHLKNLDSQSDENCTMRGKAYVSRPSLAKHRLAHRCGTCSKYFSRLWLLQVHLRTHTGEKPYECAHCGKVFAHRSNMRAHVQTHSNEKRFQCPHCLKNFALNNYLKRHLKLTCMRLRYNKKDLREEQNAETQNFVMEDT